MTSPARRCALGFAAALVLGGLCTTQGQGSVVSPLAASSVSLASLVSADPSDTTPQVNDGAVRAIATVGNIVVLGGTFTSAHDSTSSMSVPRSRLLAFDKSTGDLVPGFAPEVNSAVEAVVAGPNNSVYVGGGFTKINGTQIPHLARLDVGTGALLASFTPAAPNGPLRDIALVGSRLFIGGDFTRVGGHSLNALAVKIRKRPLESPAGNTTTIDSSDTWRYTRAATLVDGTLYSVTTDGKLWRRSFDGGVLGAKTEVDLHGLTSSLTGFAKIRSLFYANSYFYFTETGRSGLYRRAFSTEDDVLGAVEGTVSPRKEVVTWGRMGGGFLVGHHLYYSDRIDGTLRSVVWRGTRAVPGSKRLVSGHGVDGLSWKARALIAAPRS